MGIVKITICKEIVLIQHEVYHTGKHCVHPQLLFKFGSREEPPVQRKSFGRNQALLGRCGGHRGYQCCRSRRRRTLWLDQGEGVHKLWTWTNLCRWYTCWYTCWYGYL